MIAAKELRKTNISEYLLYMFHIEDIIRSFELDEAKIKTHIIEKYQSASDIKSIEAWYSDIIMMMKAENKVTKGHISIIEMNISELESFHLKLLTSEEEDYKNIFKKVDKTMTDILSRAENKESFRVTEACINIMYWYLMQKLSKQDVSGLQMQQIQNVSAYLASLSKYFYKYENGLYELS